MEANKYPGQVVFGLDIGTRSIVGTVGYQSGEQFIVLGQVVREHQTRAMLDGQIHDIGQVGATISEVKEALEKQLNMKLKDVCIAAAGRVLKTINIRADISYEEDHDIRKEDIYGLETLGVEQAYLRFAEENHTDVRFYCVGYTIVRYYLNDYPIGNLEDHKARKIGADMIATFLPDDVVDGLYKAVEIAGLNVANLTLEPIAAIQVAIPPMYRMLNIALVDVGAGTSDISITKDGSIVAYGMIPTAGDSLTEAVAGHCLVDFDTAERIKRTIATEESVAFTDIMGLPQVITRDEVYAITKPLVDSMAKQVSDKIKELNGDKPVSAVFIVGGGGKIQGYDEALAEHMGIVKERVALRGEEVMQKIQFIQPDIKKDSLLVTPVGICLAFYAQSNNFIYVTFNHKRVKLYDNSKLTVADAALQADFPNSGLFPKRGQELRFMLNDKEKIVRGGLGEAAVIKVNGNACDITAPIRANDVIEVTESTAGEAATCKVGKLPEYHTNIAIVVNGMRIELPKYATVNGQMQSESYEIAEGDAVEITKYYTVEQLLQFLDMAPETVTVSVNNAPAQLDTKVYENFTVNWQAAEVVESAEEDLSEDDYESESGADDSEAETGTTDEAGNAAERSKNAKTAEKAEQSAPDTTSDTIVVVANGRPVTLSGKKEYIYVDIFDYIDFDLSAPRGKSVVTLLNGVKAGYVETLKQGDRIDIYWEN